jgi:hypothetical protein
VLLPESPMLPVSSTPPASSTLPTSIIASSQSSACVAAGELCATDELRNGNLCGIELCIDEPRFAQIARRCYAESAYCKRMFQVFQVFHMHVASVSRGYCIYCHGYTRMLQVYCSKCFSFFEHMLQVFYLNVAYVSHICYKCFIWMLYCFTHMLQVFHLDVIAYVLQWLHTCFSWCFKRMLQVFQLFWTYVVRFQLDVAKVDLVFHILQ